MSAGATQPGLLVSVLAALLGGATVGCAGARGGPDVAALPQVARPAGCVEVAAGTPVQPVLDDPAVAAVCLGAGRHLGPLRLRRAVTLWGPAEAVVGAPSGTLIDVTGAGAAVLGLTVDGRGGRFDKLDSAVRLAADDTRVEGVTVVNTMFGIGVEKARRVRVVGNRIHGSRDPANGLRGDTIRMWETRDSLVEANHITDGRDLVVWYSRGNTLRGNLVDGGRYGLHFMYSHDNVVTGNELVRGVVGIFVMYSRGLQLTDNLIADASGAAGMAIGLKDAGNITVTGNRLVHNTLGVYVDSSPMQRGDRVTISGNVLRLNEAGLVFHSSAHDLTVHDNDLADNGVQVRVDGGGDALTVDWHGNYFDDYTGYDLDGDAIGDVPYQLRSLSNELTARTPGLALLRGTLAMAMVDAAGHLDPLYQPKPILSDPAPRLDARWPVGSRRTR